jgi:alpha-L-rhamnosidase
MGACCSEQQSVRRHRPVRALGRAAELVGLAGARVPDGIDGRDMTNAFVRGGPAPRHEHLYWEFHEQGGKQAVRMGDWKAVRLDVIRNSRAPIELYDLSTDLAEEHDVAAQHPEIVRAMEVIMVHERTASELSLPAAAHLRCVPGGGKSRYPAFLEQFIPLYSLVWVTMVHDYWMHRDDHAFVRQFLPGIEQVLGWFARHLNTDGMLEPLFHLDFVDWSYQPRRAEILAAPGSRSMSVHTLFYAYTLDRAAELFEHFGRIVAAGSFREQSRQLREAVYRRCYDAARGLFADTPDKALFSQHANVLAVLAGALPAEQQRGLLERTLAAGLLEVDLYFEYFMGRALNQAGLGDRYLERLEPGAAMLRLGMRTFGEVKGNPRSEAHAWSASPSYELLATVLGVEPAAPGFAQVRVAPHLGSLTRAEGTVPHPAGEIEVRQRQPDGALTGEITLPPGVIGTLHWQGSRLPLSGQQRVSLPAGDTIR